MGALDAVARGGLSAAIVGLVTFVAGTRSCDRSW
jgi:hypothetical protein